MVHEFEGKSEKEAIEKAISSLSLKRDEIDVEIIENKKKSLFGKGKVKIRVYTHDEVKNEIVNENKKTNYRTNNTNVFVDESEFEQKVVQFLTDILSKMGIELNDKISILSRDDDKLILDIHAENSALLIGKKGNTLNALQLLLNVYAGKAGGESKRIVVDVEDYRTRREKSLILLAKKTADKVNRSRRSVLLHPMNPFERRLIHITLNTYENIETVSEGDGLYKKIRVYYKKV
jgi:spoIIIJ-associated protein